MASSGISAKLRLSLHSGTQIEQKPPEVKKKAIDLYLEGMGFQTIWRVLKISYITVYHRVRKAGESVNMTKVEKPVAVVELDEMHSYVGRKRIIVGCGSP